MDNTLLITSITTALSIGLSCGAGCSPIITTFLTTYILSHSNGIKKAVISYISFFLGKVLSVSALCVISAIISKQFIDKDGFIGSINLRLVAQLCMSAIGIVMVVRWILENNNKKESKCESCKNCNHTKKVEYKEGILPMLLAGITYGLTPCAPLIIMIAYTFSIPVFYAGITGIVFALSSIISPVLLLIVITGALTKKIRKEIPDYLKWFKLASYILLIIMPFIIH